MIRKLLLVLLLCSGMAHAQTPTAVVSWDAYAAADVTLFTITGYRLERSIQPIGTTCTSLLTYTVVTTVAVSILTYTDPAQQLNKRQCYQIRGMNAVGPSDPSNAVGKDFPAALAPSPLNFRIVP